MRKKPNKSTEVAGNGVHGNGNGNLSQEVEVLPEKKSRKIKVKESDLIHPQLEHAAYQQFSGVLDHRELLRVLTEVKNGNFTARMPFDQIGLSGKICDTLNDIISMNEKMMHEFTRAGHIIGKQGKLNQRIEVPTTKGSWSTGIDSLNVLISDLVHPTIQIANVISSVAKVNLSQQMPL